MTTRHLPMTRAECVNGPRPCPYISCRHHLAGDRILKKAHVYSRKPVDLDEDWIAGVLEGLAHSCALDVVEQRGELTLEIVGELMGWTRERARQVEAEALGNLRDRLADLR